MYNTTHITQAMLDQAETIEVLSGEGEYGTLEKFEGVRTIGAVRAALRKERCGGDRWAILILDGQRT